jgi:hypothetical protein
MIETNLVANNGSNPVCSNNKDGKEKLNDVKNKSPPVNGKVDGLFP